jgi:outer membrane protein assembly factor BamB
MEHTIRTTIVMRLTNSTALLFLMLIVEHAAAHDWPRFRGPNGAGQSDEATIPVEWTDDDFCWKVPLPGIGHSSPVVWDESVFLTSGDPQTGDQLVLCLEARQGRELWQQRIHGEPYSVHLRNSFASSTPAVDHDHLYVAWISDGQLMLAAIDRTGQRVWEKQLGTYHSRHGFGTSPIIYGDTVILANDQEEESFLIALDRRSGGERWKSKRIRGTAAYATPCVYDAADGPDELIFNSTANGMTSINPLTGETNWKMDVFRLRVISSPIATAGLIFGTYGSGQGGNTLVAVRPAARPGEEPQLVYPVEKGAPYVPTPVANNDLVFLWTDRGVVSCIEAEDGKQVWQHRVGGNYSGSPIRVADRIYCISDDGEVVVVAAQRDFKLLARNPLGEPSRATPAVAGGRMYLRTERSLVCVGSRE